MSIHTGRSSVAVIGAGMAGAACAHALLAAALLGSWAWEAAPTASVRSVATVAAVTDDPAPRLGS